jgi:hypothetical protein
METSSRSWLTDFNDRLAATVTRGIGTMWAAYIFTVIGLLALPGVLEQSGWVPENTFPHWITGGLLTFIGYLSDEVGVVLLSVIMVGQRILDEQAERRDALNAQVTGRLREVLEGVERHLADQDTKLARLLGEDPEDPDGR